MSKRARLLWDSSCFIAILNEEPEVDVLMRTIDLARKGELELVVSTMALSEVIFRRNGKRRSRKKKQHDEILVQDFFENEYIHVRSHDVSVANKGRELCWDHEIRAHDAIHVATALLHSCDAMETTDTKLITACTGAISGLPIITPKDRANLDMLPAFDAAANPGKD